MAEETTEEVTSGGASCSVRRRVLRWAGWLLLGLVVVLLAMAAALPWVVTAIDYPEIRVDLDPYLDATNRLWFANRTLTAKVSVSGGLCQGYRVNCRGRVLDWDYRADVTVDLGWIRAEGEAEALIVGSPWKAKATYQAAGLADWSVKAEVPEIAFDERTTVLAELLTHIAPKDLKGLSLAGRLSASTQAESTPERPYPVWQAKGRLEKFGASCESGETAVSLGNLRCSVAASGMADHVDLAPLFPRADFLEAGEFAVSNLFASVRATETAFLVTEAGADVAGGQMRAYSFFLDPKRLNAGVTLFLDNIEANEVMCRLAGFQGAATGRLQGRLPIRVKDGREIRLGNAYLYSIPGETGTLRVTDSGPVLENLAMAGISKAERENLAKALENLDYTVFRINLDREDEDAFALAIRLTGTATRGKTTVPVALAVTFHGALEKLLNMGIETLQKGK